MENEKFQGLRFLELDDAFILFLSDSKIIKRTIAERSLRDHFEPRFLSGYFSNAFHHVGTSISFYGEE